MNKWDNIKDLLTRGKILKVYGIENLIPIIKNINELKLNTLMIQQGYEENMFSSIGDVYYIKLDDKTLRYYDNIRRSGLPIKFNEHGYNECPICQFGVETDDCYCSYCGQKIYLELNEDLLDNNQSK